MSGRRDEIGAGDRQRGPPDLVIFDCDGVLVDSEPISIAVLLELFGESGIAVDEAVAYERFLGRSMGSVAEICRADFGLDLTRAHLDKLRLRLFRRFAAELKPIPGIEKALDGIAAPRCVASSSQPDRIRFSLGVAGLLERLEPHIYSSSMVEHGKPAPDLFLHAAQSMGFAPDGCLVIEDSPAGIEAARRAGMRVFAFVGAAHAGHGPMREAVAALAPDLIFDDMGELPSLIASLGRPAQAS